MIFCYIILLIYQTILEFIVDMVKMESVSEITIFGLGTSVVYGCIFKKNISLQKTIYWTTCFIKRKIFAQKT